MITLPISLFISVFAMIYGDTIQPRRNLGIAAEVQSSLKSADKRFLRQVTCFFGVVNKPEDQIVDRLFVTRHQRVKVVPQVSKIASII